MQERRIDFDLIYYAKVFTGLLIMFGFGYIPPVEPITALGMKVAGIFMGCIFLWSTIGLIWPSIFAIVAMMLSGYSSPKAIIASSFGDTVPVLLLFAMTVFGLIQHYDVPRYISRWFLTRKSINGRPLVFTFIFMIATNAMALSSGSILAILIFMWTVLYGILKELKFTKEDKYAHLIVIGTMIAAMLGQPMKFFQGSGLMILSAFEKASGMQINSFAYLLFGMCMNLLLISLYVLSVKYVFKTDLSKLENINVEYFERDPLPPMNNIQKLMFATLIAFWVLVLIPSVLPKSIAFVAMLDKLSALGILMIFTGIFMIIKVDNKPIMPIKDIIGKYVSWEIYFLLSASMCLSAALSNPKTGLTEYLAINLAPLLGGHSAIMFTSIVLILGMCVTQFANNGVSGVVLMPVIQIFAEQSGANFSSVAALFCFIMHSAMLTPAGSPYAALIFSNKEWLEPKLVLKYGSFTLLLFISLYLFIGIPLGNFIFEMFPPAKLTL